MNAIEIILLNFSEIRRRSIKLWSGIPSENYHWKPDDKALSIIQMIRHVLEAEHLFHVIIDRKGNLDDYVSPWKGLAYKDLNHELVFAESYHHSFLDMIKGLSEIDLETIRIVRSEVNQDKTLGDYLNRIAYHEAVHAGQMLDYFRSAGISRPIIWD